MKVASSIMGMIIVGALSGCSDTAPKCSDSETQDLVIEISKEELAKQAGKQVADSVTLKLSAIRTTDYNEKTGSQQCVADLELKGQGGTKSIEITYKTELTDDGDEFYVTVYGL